MQDMVAEAGSRVCVHYEGTLDDGMEFDSSVRRGEPVEFVVGSRRMLPGFERAICGMRCGERKTLRIPADEAYGLYDDGLLESVSKSDLPDLDSSAVGSFLVLATPADRIRAKILRIEKETVVLDFNHELAGQNLHYAIELISVSHLSAVQQETHAHGCGCGCDRLKQSLRPQRTI